MINKFLLLDLLSDVMAEEAGEQQEDEKCDVCSMNPRTQKKNTICSENFLLNIY